MMASIIINWAFGLLVDKFKKKNKIFETKICISIDIVFNLAIRDSFSCVLMPYLAVGTKSVTTIDMRHYEEMSVAEYIDKNDIDIVIVAYNPTSFNSIQFDFFK